MLWEQASQLRPGDRIKCSHRKLKGMLVSTCEPPAGRSPGVIDRVFVIWFASNTILEYLPKLDETWESIEPHYPRADESMQEVFLLTTPRPKLWCRRSTLAEAWEALQKMKPIREKSQYPVTAYVCRSRLPFCRTAALPRLMEADVVVDDEQQIFATRCSVEPYQLPIALKV